MYSIYIYLVVKIIVKMASVKQVVVTDLSN